MPSPKRSYILRLLLLSITLASPLLVSGEDTDDSLLQAKRQTVNDLMRRGQFSQAAAMCRDLLDTDPTHYQDHLALARAEDKLGNLAPAIAEFEAVRDLLPSTPQNSDQRSAIAEVERRIRVLDPTSEKLRSAITDFEKKLDELERSARAARSQSGLEKIQAIRSQLLKTVNLRSHIFIDVAAKAPWFNTGLIVEAGKKYEVFATGKWGTGEYPNGSCDADGTADRPAGQYPEGALIGSVIRNQALILGKHTTFTAPDTAPLWLEMNAPEGPARAGYWGSQHVYIGLVPQLVESK